MTNIVYEYSVHQWSHDMETLWMYFVTSDHMTWNFMNELYKWSHDTKFYEWTVYKWSHDTKFYEWTVYKWSHDMKFYEWTVQVITWHEVLWMNCISDHMTQSFMNELCTSDHMTQSFMNELCTSDHMTQSFMNVLCANNHWDDGEHPNFYLHQKKYDESFL